MQGILSAAAVPISYSTVGFTEGGGAEMLAGSELLAVDGADTCGMIVLYQPNVGVQEGRFFPGV